LLLANHILIEKGLNLLRLRQLIGMGSLWGRRAVVFQDGIAHRHALVADVSPRIIAGRGNQFCYGVLRLVAERTAQHLLCAGSVFHSAYSFSPHWNARRARARIPIIPFLVSYR